MNGPPTDTLEAEGLMQQALGPDWNRLPPALQAHHRGGILLEQGHLDIRFPALLKPLLWLVACMGALVHRRGTRVPTRVARHTAHGVQRWQRVLQYPDGRQCRFDSVWEAGRPGHLVEFVNPVLGLELAPRVEGGCLHYRGVRWVVRWGRRRCHLPAGGGLGAAQIVEREVDAAHIAMEFHLHHPWLGEVYRYAGVFQVDLEDVPHAAPVERPSRPLPPAQGEPRETRY